MISNRSGWKKNSLFTVSRMGTMDKWRNYFFNDPSVPTTQGKCFLRERLNLTGMEVSLNVLASGEGIPFYHKHRENEELYIFIKGRGQFQVDGKVFCVEEGSIVHVAPEGMRAYRNNSSQNLYFIVVQAKAGSITGESISDGIGVGTSVEWPSD